MVFAPCTLLPFFSLYSLHFRNYAIWYTTCRLKTHWMNVLFFISQNPMIQAKCRQCRKTASFISHLRFLSSNTVTWLPTRMPSSHLDTDMAFLSDKSIVYTLTLGAVLTTKSAVPLPKWGAPWIWGATSTLNPYPVFPNWFPTPPSVLHLQTHPLIGFLLVSLCSGLSFLFYPPYAFLVGRHYAILSRILQIMKCPWWIQRRHVLHTARNIFFAGELLRIWM